MTLQSKGRRSARDPLGTEIARRAPWFHNLHLPSGHETAPDHPLGDFPRFKWEQIAPHLQRDLSGWTALDVGCNAGFYTFQLATRGATVLGIDLDEHYLAQARWAASQFEFDGRVRFERRHVYELGRSTERYDLVFFLGVLYHLRYPLLALDLLAHRTKRRLVLQTLTMPGEEALEPPRDLEIDDRERLREPGWPKLAFIERRLAGDPTNWWAPNHGAVEAMARSAGLEVVARPGHEIYVCKPGRVTRHLAELQAATGVRQP